MDRDHRYNKEDLAKYTIKDSVFTSLFSDKKYIVQLYEALHPEAANVTEDDITSVTLENILMAGQFNDLGFRVNDRLVILMECQNVWTSNIVIRMLLYMANTYHNYYTENEINLYSTKKANFPKPELYMLYTGNDTNKTQEIISLKDDFLNGEESSIDVRVKVIYNSKKGDIISQYIMFTKIYNEQVKLHGRTREAVLETIRICKDEGVLRDYLASKEKEAISIMMTLFDKEYVLNTYLKDMAKENREEGREEGMQIGLKEGSILSAIETYRECGVSFADIIKKIATKFNLSESDAEAKVKACWQ